MTQINTKFAAAVTDTAFSLTLSRSMIVCLIDIANAQTVGTLRAHGFRETTVPTRHRLRERGLIIAPSAEWPGRYILTDAGSHVIALLRIAGLVEEPTQIKELSE